MPLFLSLRESGGLYLDTMEVVYSLHCFITSRDLGSMPVL